MNYGYAGKIALIDLSTRSTQTFQFPDQLKIRYLGGRGFIADWLFRNIPSTISAHDPDNALIFAAGGLTGTLAPSSARLAVGAVAPETGIWSIGNVGGFFGVQLRMAGWDAIIIKGISEIPVYLHISDQKISFHPAKHLWGLTTSKADEMIRSESSDNSLKIGCIGPAGENGVLFSTIIFEGVRSAGRGGLGAVMGYKKLKAIAVKGSGNIAIKEPARFYSECLTIIRKSAKLYFKKRWNYGSYGKNRGLNEVGALSIRNAQLTSFEGNEIEGIAAEEYIRNYKQTKAMRACFACPIPCWTKHYIPKGFYAGLYSQNANATTFKEMGARCGLSHMDAILHASHTLNQYGLDTISTPAVIAFAFECFQRGIITQRQTDGLALEWNNPEAVMELIERIASVQGIGIQLSLGVKKCAQLWGNDAEYLALHVKGLETVGTDPRGQPSWGLGYATSSRGACHMRAYTNFENRAMRKQDLLRVAGTTAVEDRFGYLGKGRGVAYLENLRAFGDALGVCHLLTSTELGFPEVWTDLFEAGTGLHLDPEELYSVGERIYTLERLSNLQRGLTSADDMLPRRYLVEPIPSGPATGKVCPLEPMLEEYYAFRDWDRTTGYPSREKLNALDLDLYL